MKSSDTMPADEIQIKKAPNPIPMSNDEKLAWLFANLTDSEFDDVCFLMENGDEKYDSSVEGGWYCPGALGDYCYMLEDGSQFNVPHLRNIGIIQVSSRQGDWLIMRVRPEWQFSSQER